MSGARFGFFKNKTNAGVTATFPGRYPTWPTMPNASVYTYFINSAKQTAPPVFDGNVSPGLFEFASGTNRGPTTLALPLTDGNAIITQGQFNTYKYDYTTNNFSNISANLSFSGTGLTARVVKTMNAYAWADNGNVDVFYPNDHVFAYEGNTVYTYDITGGTIRGFNTSNPFRACQSATPLLDGNVLLLRNRDKLSVSTYTNGPPSEADGNGNLPLCKYNPNTNVVTYLGNSIHYANCIAFTDAGSASNVIVESASNAPFGTNIKFPTVANISRNTGNIYILPGQGCIANIYTYQGGSVPTVDVDQMRQKCIIEHDPINNVTTEHTPANITIQIPELIPAMDLDAKRRGSFELAIYESSITGADNHIYAFPGGLNTSAGSAIFDNDIFSIKEWNAILRIDPDNLANCEQSTFGIWDNTGDYTTNGTQPSNANMMIMGNTTSSFLSDDGHVTWVCYIQGPNASAVYQPANAYICWLDTNPTSNTYLTGGKTLIGGTFAPGSEWGSRNYAFTGGNVWIGGPAKDQISNIANAGLAAQTITTSGTVVPATLYATWNRKNNGAFNTAT